MFESVLCNKFFRLCALATAGRAEEDEIEHVGRVPLLCNGVQIYRDFQSLQFRSVCKKAIEQNLKPDKLVIII
jgi:hypothetical protein